MVKKSRRRRPPALARNRNRARARHARRQRLTVIDFKVIAPPEFVDPALPWIVMLFSGEKGFFSDAGHEERSAIARVKKADEALREAGYLTWSPVMRKRLTIGRRRTVRTYPLMPGCLFATGAIEGLGCEIYDIPATQMARFVETLRGYAERPPQAFLPHQRVVVRGGSYDIEAEFVRQIDDDIAEVRASLLGRETTWQVEVEALEER